MSFLNKCCSCCLPCWTAGESVHPIESEVYSAQLPQRPQSQRVQQAAGFLVRGSQDGQELREAPFLPIFIKAPPTQLKQMQPILMAKVEVEEAKVEVEEVNPTKQYIRTLQNLGIMYQKYLDILAKERANPDVERSSLIERSKIYIEIENKMKRYEELGFKNTKKIKYLDLLRTKLEQIYFPSEVQGEGKLIEEPLINLEKKLFKDLFIRDLIDLNLNTDRIASILTKLDFYFKNNNFKFLNDLKKRIIDVFNLLNPYASLHKKPIDDALFAEILEWAIEPKDLKKSLDLEELTRELETRLLCKLLFTGDKFTLNEGQRASPAAETIGHRGLLSGYRAISGKDSSIGGSEGDFRESPILDLMKKDL
jgi:hypothetical protein